MLNRQQLTITAVADLLTNSTEFAASLVQASKKEDAKEEKSGKSQAIPWKLLIVAGGSTIAGLIAYMKDVEGLIPHSSDTGDLETDTDSKGPDGSEGDSTGESLLDKVVSWFNSIPETTAPVPDTRTIPVAPAIASTNSGQTFVGSIGDSGSATPEGAASYVRLAANTVGIDPGLTFAVAKIESNLNVDAKNRVTGATGLNQFTPSTWKFLIKKYPSLGFSENDINDPKKNALMGAVYLKQISQSLSKGLNREPSATEIYLGHFLGPSGAISFLRSLTKNPEASAPELFPAAAKANPNIFFDKKTPRTLAQVFDLMNAKVTKAKESYSATSVEQVPPVSGAASSSNPIATSTSTPSVSPLIQPSADASLFLSAKIVAKRPAIASTPQASPSPEQEATGSVSSASVSPTKSYARTKQGTLVAFSTP